MSISMKRKYILVINPGSTSTKIAIFTKKGQCIIGKTLRHSKEELAEFDKVYDQKDFRTRHIMDWLKEIGVSLGEIDIAVGRGGLLRHMPGGTYLITPKMLDDLRIGYQGQHASNLGGIIANEIGKKVNVDSYIVDPVAVDELEDVARFSGLSELPRTSLVHALNIKAVVRRVAKKLYRDFHDGNYVVAHLGGGISIAAISNGNIIDVSNGHEGGPFSPERCGELPSVQLVDLAFSGEYSEKYLIKKMQNHSGLIAYLGTNDVKVIDKRIEEGNRESEVVLKAMSQQISKEIGAMAVALKGQVDSVILTGGLAYNTRLVNWITEKVSFVAPIEIVPGEDEMISLVQGVLRVLNGEEKAKIYEEEVQMG